MCCTEGRHASAASHIADLPHTGTASPALPAAQPDRQAPISPRLALIAHVHPGSSSFLPLSSASKLNTRINRGVGRAAWQEGWKRSHAPRVSSRCGEAGGGGHRDPPSLVFEGLLLISPAQSPEHPSGGLLCCSNGYGLPLVPRDVHRHLPPAVSPVSPGILQPVPTPSVSAGTRSQACELLIATIQAPIPPRQSREREPRPPHGRAAPSAPRAPDPPQRSQHHPLTHRHTTLLGTQVQSGAWMGSPTNLKSKTPATKLLQSITGLILIQNITKSFPV